MQGRYVSRGGNDRSVLGFKIPVDREPPAPTPLDEVMSVMFLESAPWVQSRIKKLRLSGRLVRGWTPPTVPDPCAALPVEDL